jgi:hypothetical protein
VRNRVGQAPGGGAVTLKTKQVDDPAHPLTLATTRSGKAAIKSVSFTVNGHALKNTSKVNVTWLKTGSGKVNVVVATVKLRNGKTVKLTQKLIILRCHPPAAACTRQANGLSLSCQSKTPLGGRKVSVTVTRPPTDKASGSASVTKGRYTIVVHSSRALSAGTYAYKAVVTTGHRGERFQMIRLVTVK